MIKLENLHKSFGDQVVLNGIDLEIKQGETLAILGRSGTGKSVLLKLIIGLLKPDSGFIQIAEKEITKMNTKELNNTRKKMGFLFQKGALYDSLTVEENVAFPLLRHTRKKPSEIQAQVKDLLSRTGMINSAKKMPSEISGGMQKRVGLARAIALDPEIILLDEPTTGLDPITAGEILDLLRRLQEEHHATSVIVTHDIRTVRTLSSIAAVLENGNIVAEGSLFDLERSRSEFVHSFLEQASAGVGYV
jgi:phospholipid/cholesterol/gamma-HCH transport system ATP-binding protein